MLGAKPVNSTSPAAVMSTRCGGQIDLFFSRYGAVNQEAFFVIGQKSSVNVAYCPESNALPAARLHCLIEECANGIVCVCGGVRGEV